MLNLRTRCRWLLAPSFIVTSVVATAIPSFAATLAFSEAEINFHNFSNYGSIEFVNQGNIFAETNGGIFNAENSASNNLIESPLEINSSAFSLAFGENRDYEGTAETQARVLGNFDVDAGKSFFFDFSANLNLETGIDDPLSEKAAARSDISFYLFDTTNIAQTEFQDLFRNFKFNYTSNFKYQPIDFFTLNGGLNTFGSLGFLKYQGSESIAFTDKNTQTNFGGANQQTASASIRGTLKRSFTNKSQVSLIALRQTKSEVKVPEHSMLVALIFLTLAISVLRNNYARTRISNKVH